MKKILPVILGLSLVIVGAAHADVTVTLKKAGASTASVKSWQGSKPAIDTKAPVSFGSDADWSSLKDSYSISDATAADLKGKSVTIDIASDGSLSFKKAAAHTKHHKKA